MNKTTAEYGEAPPKQTSKTDLANMTVCPVCDGVGHISGGETCSYCVGGGLVTARNAYHLSQYSKQKLQGLNDGEIPL